MTSYRAILAGMSREVLEQFANDALVRCTQLQLELRRLKGGIVLEGWTCPAPCGSFNGAGREWRTHCRSCDAPRPV